MFVFMDDYTRDASFRKLLLLGMFFFRASSKEEFAFRVFT